MKDRTRTLADVFAEQVAAGPDRLAVTVSDGQMTYRDLDERSAALAGGLTRAGVLPGDIVALSMRRGADMIVSLLAVLRTGAAYLPLDPSTPRARIDQILTSSNAALLLTDGLTTAGHGADVLLIDAAADAPAPTAARAPTEPTATATATLGLAYVIYTSGSTGEPKGVRVTHANVLSLLDQMESVLDITDADAWTVFHSLAFDFSVWEIWGALSHGCRMVIVDDEAAKSSQRLVTLLREEKVTVLNQTPSAFLSFLRAEATDSAGLPHLRLVILGGERVSLPALAGWLQRHERRPELINMYGLTECTVFSSSRRLTAADVSLTSDSPIGAPLPGNEFLVLDPQGRAVADEEEGELFVLGPTVSAGYINSSSEGGDRFAPVTAANGQRAYRTGDLVLRRPSGDHLYLGRNDRQVKVRGYRVDPTEIERHLLTLEPVGAAVVIDRDYGDGDVRLVAHLVPPPGQAADAEWQAHAIATARTAVALVLPGNLCPSIYEAVDALPLTTSGKVDLSALRSGMPNRAPEPRPHAADTPTGQITEIWQRLLGAEDIDVEDDVFDMGGTSLTLMKMIHEVRQTFGHPIDIQVLLDGATIAVLAKAVEAAGDEPAQHASSS